MNIILSYTKTRTDALVKTNEYSIAFNNSTFRYPTDICTPTIRLTVNSLIVSINNVNYNISTDFNYVFIGEINKYYFIQNVSIISNNVVDIYLSEDYVASLAPKISLLKCRVDRNENEWDSEILDDKCNFKNTINVEYITPTNTLSSNHRIDNTHACILMTIYATRKAWEDSHWLREQIWELPQYTENVSVGPNETLTPLNCMRNQYNSTYTLVLNALEYSYIMGYLANRAELLTFVKNVRVLPISASYVGYEGQYSESEIKSTQVPIGDTVINFLTEASMPQQSLRLLYTPFYVFNEFGFDFDTVIANSNLGQYVGTHDWLLKKPYSVIKIFIPYYGYVELNYEYCKGEEIKVYYYIEPEVDDDYVMIIRTSDNKILFKDTAQISMSVPLNYDNTYHNKVLKQDAQNTMNTEKTISYATTIIGGIEAIVGTILIGTGVAAGAGIGLITAGAGTIVGGVSTNASSETKYTNTVNELFDQSYNRTGTGLGGKVDSDDVFIRIENYVPTDDYDTALYRSTVGNPLSKVRTLGNMFGFTTCSSFVIDFGNTQEKENIRDMLVKGIYIN